MIVHNLNIHGSTSHQPEMRQDEDNKGGCGHDGRGRHVKEHKHNGKERHHSRKDNGYVGGERHGEKATSTTEEEDTSKKTTSTTEEDDKTGKACS